MPPPDCNNSTRASTVVPYVLAILERVSPDFTVWMVAPPADPFVVPPVSVALPA